MSINPATLANSLRNTAWTQQPNEIQVNAGPLERVSGGQMGAEEC